MIKLFGFSLRNKSSNIVSVDEAVMEEAIEMTRFRDYQCKKLHWKFDPDEFSDTNGMLPEINSIKSDDLKAAGFSNVIAVGIYCEDFIGGLSEFIKKSQLNIDFSKYSGGDLITHGWSFCGYDIADILQFSILNVENIKPKPDLNRYGLISEYSVAKSVSNIVNDARHDHSPFFPNAIYIL